MNGSFNNPYNGFSAGFMPDELFFRRKNEKERLKRLSLYTGSAILMTMLLQNFSLFALIPFGLYDLYFENQYFQSGADIILTVIGMLVPFAFFGKKMKSISGEENPVPLEAPKNKSLSLLGIIGGVGACLAANYITSFVVIFMGIFGYELSSPELAMPKGGFGIFIAFIRISVVAAVVEELSLRGFVMGNLRSYGDRFAIVMSAFVFAFIHGNLIQTPFALAAGIVLGYVSVKTNSIWTGIIIHIINNSISLAFSYLMDILPEETINLIYLLVMGSLIIIGFICLRIFMKKTESTPLRQNYSLLSAAERVSCYLLSPTMIASIIIMLFVTANFVTKK